MVETKKPGLLQRVFGLAEPGGVVPSTSPNLPAPQPSMKPQPVENEEKQFTPLKTGAIGTSGTIIYSGYPSEEYLQQLRGRRRADVYDQMRRSDGQIKMCIAAVKNPIKGAIWEIEAGHAEGEDATPEAKEDAELIKHILFNDLDKPWKKKVSEILSFIEFGHSVFEVTHKVVMNHPRFGTYNGIQSLGWRSQRTIERWNVDKQTERLSSITQVAFGDLGRMVDIPDEFLMKFSIEQEGSNYEGVSMLRPCYGNWKRKELYLKLNALGIEKFAVPPPMAEVPEDKQDSEQFNNLIDALENYTSGESAYLTYPAGWKIDIKPSAYDPTKVEESIDREDTRMAKAFLCNFLELGMSGGGGAYALSTDLSDFMLSGLEFTADEIEEPFNEILIPALIKMNKGPREFYPKLKHSGISDKAGQELATMLKSLAESKWLTPEDGDEAHLRRRIGLPTRTGKGAREVMNISERVDANSAPNPTLSEKIKLAEKRRIKVRG